jgi:hypothetical protein
MSGSVVYSLEEVQQESGDLIKIVLTLEKKQRRKDVIKSDKNMTLSS